MFDGTNTITRAPLYYSLESFFGKADILEKKKWKSVFGRRCKSTGKAYKILRICQEALKERALCGNAKVR